MMSVETGTARRAESLVPPINWWPMMFSVFGLLIPNGLAMRDYEASVFEWVMAGVGWVAFVALSAVAVVSWQRNRRFLWVVPLLVALGIVYTPMVFAGTIFFGLAAHMLPWAVGGNARRTALYGVPMVALVLSGYWLMPEHGSRWINISIYYALTIAGQVWIVRMCVNLRRFAEGAERERIADDLHDLLGEALSKITLKSQKAGILLESEGDCDRARAEIAAAERICRKALTDVRQTIRAYRDESRKDQGRVHVAG